MEYVADKELELGDNIEVHHSFFPLEWPENVSQIPSTAKQEREDIAKASTAQSKCLAMSKVRRFLPCHYFDHICGSSTGA